MYLFPLGKRILAIRAVYSGISGNFWGCRDIAFLLLLSTFLLTSSCPPPKYPSFSLSLSIPFANGVLNMVTVISVIIAMGLLPNLSIPHVLQKMAQGLRYVWPDPDISLPGASALSYRCQQLGVEPLHLLFKQVCQPRATPQTPGAFRFGLRLMAIDSTLE